jgi:hypothetical protein
MTKIYDFDWHRLKKEDTLRKSLGYDEELWLMMKESGYDVTLQEERDKFFKDLEDLQRG